MTTNQIRDHIASHHTHTAAQATALQLLNSTQNVNITGQEHLRALLLNDSDTWQQRAQTCGQAQDTYQAWLLILFAYRQTELKNN